MTTVPLSVSYGGAKPLGPYLGALTSFPDVRPVGHTRGVRGPKSTVPSSANLVGSVAAERSYRAFGAPVPNYSMLGGECSLLVLGLMSVPMLFSFLIIVPISLFSGPFVSSRIPCFVPKRRSQRGVVVSRA